MQLRMLSQLPRTLLAFSRPERNFFCCNAKKSRQWLCHYFVPFSEVVCHFFSFTSSRIAFSSVPFFFHLIIKRRAKSVERERKRGGSRFPNRENDGDPEFVPGVLPCLLRSSSIGSSRHIRQMLSSRKIRVINHDYVPESRAPEVCEARGSDCSRKLNSGPRSVSYLGREKFFFGTSVSFFMREWQSILMR